MNAPQTPRRAVQSISGFAAFVLLLLAFAGTAAAESHAATRPSVVDCRDAKINLGAVKPDVAAWLGAFEAPGDGHFSYTLERVESEKELRVYRVTYASPVVTPFPENNVVPAELYLPPGDVKDRLPAAIVLDILDGTAIVPRALARSLAYRGVAAIYFPMPYYNVRKPRGNVHLKLLDEDVKYVADPMRQTVMDARRAKAVLASLPWVDADRIGITGVSLGGIMTSLVAGVDGTFHRVCPVMAGGDMATLIFHTREMRKLKERLEAKGVSRDDLAKLLAPVEPLNFANRIDPKSCLMINASRDEVIPRESTDQLFQAIGRPQILWMPTGHYSAAWYLVNVEQKVADFMLGREVTTIELK